MPSASCSVPAPYVPLSAAGDLVALRRPFCQISCARGPVVNAQTSPYAFDARPPIGPSRPADVVPQSQYTFPSENGTYAPTMKPEAVALAPPMQRASLASNTCLVCPTTSVTSLFGRRRLPSPSSTLSVDAVCSLDIPAYPRIEPGDHVPFVLPAYGLPTTPLTMSTAAPPLKRKPKRGQRGCPCTARAEIGGMALQCFGKMSIAISSAP